MRIYKTSQSRQVTVQDMGGYRKVVPIITLRGKWLLQANIFPKDKLSVSVSEGIITLSVVEESPEKREELRMIEEQNAQRKTLSPDNQKINIPWKSV